MQNVNWTLHTGVCYGLLGENGAGKSTLIKILTGIYSPSEGEIYWKGSLCEHLDPDSASHLGITAVHQELTLVDTLSISNNIFLGNEPTTRRGFVDVSEMNRRSKALLESWGMQLDVSMNVSLLSLADKQMIEVAKAIMRNPDLLILDEGTSALTEEKVTLVHQIVQDMKREGKTVILISHRMKEIFQFCDEILILKDGKKVGECDVSNTTEDTMIAMMSGVQADKSMPPKFCDYDEDIKKRLYKTVLETKDLCVDGRLKNINITLRSGEILGLGGLQGHGQVDLVNALFGIEKISSGEILLDGHRQKIRHPWHAVKNGLFLVPQSRRVEGLFTELSVAENITVNAFKSISCMGVIRRKAEKQLVDSTIQSLKIKVAAEDQLVKFLSGGNQQKIAFGKWLCIHGKVLLLIEPTRGIDVRTKSEIYNTIRRLAMEGYAVLIVSSEMHELIGLSDRVAVFYENEIVSEFSGEDINDINILAASFGKTAGRRDQ